MGNVDRLPISTHIEEAAAGWVARHDSGPLDERAAAEFDAWLQASPAHRAAFARFENLWSDFDSLSSRPAGTFTPEPANDRTRFYVSRRAVAAGGLLALISVAALATLEIRGDAAAKSYATAVGEQRAVTLADNSRITLNTDTRFRVEFSEGVRRIALERGEALFEVARDPARPFIVASPGGSVRAVGTKFVVRIRDENRLDVLVTEGRVVVSRTAPASGRAVDAASPAPISAGQQLRVEPERLAVVSVTPDELNRELAWRQGDIVFSGEPLSQAVAEMQRYSQIRISVDSAVAHYSVGGYFRTNDVEAFLQTVESVFPVRAVRSQGNVRLVARRG